jgi:hypothetical protein
MLIISHRGNLTGCDPNNENRLETIEYVISKGFSVEVDLRIYNDKPYFGHDEPQYETSLNFLKNIDSFLWVHCKDKNSFEYALKYNLNCFWHDTDDYTMTSKGYVWAYPGKESVGNLCIGVMPEKFWPPGDTIINKKFFGICTDIPIAYQDIINNK